MLDIQEELHPVPLNASILFVPVQVNAATVVFINNQLPWPLTMAKPPPNRLDYSTSAGAFDARITFEQLIEFVRLAREDFLALSSWAKLHENPVKAKAWATNAENFAKIIPIIAHLGKGKTKSSVGFRQ